MNQQQISKALSLAYFYLKFRPRTEQEIVRYLEKKSIRFHFSEVVIKTTIETLKEQGFINDKKFVELYVENRILLKPKGIFLLRYELAKLGIAKDLIEEYFSTSQTEDLTLAEDVLRRRINTYAALDSKTRFKKAVSFLLRRGFSYDIAKKAYQTVFTV
ncbi:hypothetical protein A2334_00085 [Candidatus Roizmanbacteria bacterium RIFOXYB2_FULL_38_10]|uniref:Regulatory protein RecX n=1 Tax=Candidatus Roizmanbacteria bacterium RIFOXYD1_FULL_38_12 TaxID=1802093 RepID=A0A1F7L2D2_9BACT|nr:MAG: hypothetical protein A3K47_06050 [Candidatus Roizmanbacteria bacterium RIFOXYA2_FULL_38_14]OGK64302.1 MAG: hypothetical protein A3K27_06050 [Candidatus Roizmanbacteria bacterium RIFOXYA1_FULL_37_12]OGK66148.1 MAG: hypothetical protein A3K38_06050 [Candidatus Roizmanbacteria bacterium RIFOXYB1_FULL_40_23]OGK67833.1 MAG: hypothetical protein A2334_00085 [Candidatus Roizmanbacteria bacterium RIFOXYB2_FULL_38_10]OGK70553.1 MAG: hypothetical protein A3K21_06060 [Candidatus Roizmanbacteria ba